MSLDRDRAVRVSKLLALVLRHDPAAIGIALDAAGFADVDALLERLAARGEATTREELEEIVATSDKKRFSFSPDGEKIRANQGHSVKIDLGLPRSEPPARLWHGTVERFVASIREHGLLPGSRTHVHLSVDIATAERVARRRAGPIVILAVDARAMHDAGRALYRSENGVWLTDHVPPEFLALP